MLVFTDDGIHLSGEYLASVSAGNDDGLGPSVYFRLTPQGGQLFQRLSSENLPDDQTGHARQLGVILDNRLLTAPRIMSTIGQHGQITGQFTQQEVDLLVGVLRAGRLPYGLEPTPVSIAKIPPAIILGLSPIIVFGGSFTICLALSLALAFWLRPAGWLGLVAECLHLLWLLAMIAVVAPGLSAVEVCLIPWLLLVSLVFSVPLLAAANRRTPPIGYGIGKPAGGSSGVRAQHGLLTLAGHVVLLSAGVGLIALGIVPPIGRLLVLASVSGAVGGLTGLLLLLGLVRYAYLQRPVIAELVRTE